MPANAVSIGKVTCFSISNGESAGASVLICTWLLVMSGTASIGSRCSDRTPNAASAATSSTTKKRCVTENLRIRSITASAPPLSMLMLGFGLAELRLENEGVLDGDRFAKLKTRQNLHVLRSHRAQWLRAAS